MSRLWIRNNGKFVSDEYGRPIVCPICPCVTCDEKIVWLQHLATVYGGTFYGEGYIRTPDVDGLVAPETQVFQAAVVYTITVNDIPTQYIITVGCGVDCPLGKRILLARESYIEKAGVCDCPALAPFIENAEFAGHIVYGESILVSLTHQGGPVGSFGWYNVRAMACYLNAATNIWHYVTCACSIASISNATYSLVRVDYPCSQCLDMRSVIAGNPTLFGLIGYQQGSHTCYETGGVRHIAAGATQGSLGQTVGIIDYRVYISLHSISGSKFIHVFGLPDWKIGVRRYSVPPDAVLSGVAELFPTGWDGGWRAKKTYRMYGVHICAYLTADTEGTTATPNTPTVFSRFTTEAGAVAWSEQLASMGEQFIWATSSSGMFGSMNYLYTKESPSIDGLPVIPGEWRRVSYSPPYAAWKAYIDGPTYVMRYIETNIGLLMQDGTYRASITIPSLEAVSFGANITNEQIETTIFGTTITASIAATDPTCPDPGV